MTFELGFGDRAGIDRLSSWREWAGASCASPAALVNSIDAEFLNSPEADLSVSPATGDPRRLLGAADPRAHPRLAKPQRGSEACLNRQERKFGQQALWRFEILGDRLRRHAARGVSASGGPRRVGARFRSEGHFRSRSHGRRGDRRRSQHHDRSGAAGGRRLLERRQRGRQRPPVAGQELGHGY